MAFNAKETGYRIKTLREQHRETMYQAATALNISESHYKKIELGTRSLSFDTLLAISEKYGVTTDFLLKGTAESSFIGDLSFIISRLQSLKFEMEQHGPNQGPF